LIATRKLETLPVPARKSARHKKRPKHLTAGIQRNKIARTAQHQVHNTGLVIAVSEVERLLSNPGKMHALTGWKADVSLDEGLARTVEWMTKHRSLYKSGIYNV